MSNRRILRIAKRQGWTVEQGVHGWTIYPPVGSGLSSAWISHHAKCCGERNNVAAAKRAGVRF